MLLDNLEEKKTLGVWLLIDLKEWLLVTWLLIEETLGFLVTWLTCKRGLLATLFA